MVPLPAVWVLILHRISVAPMIGWGIAIFTLTLTIDLITDYRRYLKGKAINHRRGAILRAIGLLPAWVCLSLHQHSGWLFWAVLISGMLAFTYTCIFDPVFSILIGQKPFYVGTTSFLDRLQRKYPWLLPAKYGLAILFIIIYIIL